MEQKKLVPFESSYNIDQLNEYLSKAIEIARDAHYGQFDKSGLPNFTHPEVVCEIASELLKKQPHVSDEFLVKVKIVSYLHDVIENSVLTADDLRDKKFPADCVEAVEILTRKIHHNHLDYISAVKTNKLAAVVKIADLTHNNDRLRLNQGTDSDLAREAKNQKEIRELLKNLDLDQQ